MKTFFFYKKCALAILLSVVVCGMARSQSVPKAEISCPRCVNVGEDFSIMYTISGDSAVLEQYDVSLQLPDSTQCFKLMSRLNNTWVTATFISGKRITYSNSWSYTLRCDKPGNYTFMPIKVTCRNKNLSVPQVKEVELTVKEQMDNDAKSGEDSIREPEILLVACLDRDKVQLGDSVICTLKVLTRDQITDCGLKDCDIDNCSYSILENNDTDLENNDTDNEDDEDVEIKEVEHDGKKYFEVMLCNISIRPLKKGKITIPSFVIVGDYRAYETKTDGYIKTLVPIERPFRAESKPFVITVSKKR